MRNGVSESHLAALAQSRDRKESTLLSGRYLPPSFKSNTNAKPGNDIDQLQECTSTSKSSSQSTVNVDVLHSIQLYRNSSQRLPCDNKQNIHMLLLFVQASLSLVYKF